MSVSDDLDTYLQWPGHAPHAQPMSDVYYLAQSEMITPFPSTPLLRFPTLNKITGGLRPYEFTILCGATGTGKTTLCANLSVDLLEQGIPQFVASVETGHTDYVKRMISAMVKRDWNTGDAIPVDYLRLFNVDHEAKFKANTAQISLYDNRVPVEELMADLAYMVKHHGIKVAIVDNLNYLLEVKRAQDLIVEMDRVTHELVVFCKRIPIHLVLIMHPKKTESGRVEDEFSVKGSATAVQEAHNILLWNRPHPELVKAGTAVEGDRELMIAKMRRKGKYVRRRLLFRATEGVHYQEGSLV